MFLNNEQINASILAIAQAFNPDFWDLSDEEKGSMGREAWWWFGRLVRDLPEGANPRSLYDSNSEVVRAIAVDYIMGMIRQDVPAAKKMSDEDLKTRIKTIDIDTQSSLFMQLGSIGLAAAEDNAAIAAAIENFDLIDFEAEMKKLLA